MPSCPLCGAEMDSDGQCTECDYSKPSVNPAQLREGETTDENNSHTNKTLQNLKAGIEDFRERGEEPPESLIERVEELEGEENAN